MLVVHQALLSKCLDLSLLLGFRGVDLVDLLLKGGAQLSDFSVALLEQLFFLENGLFVFIDPLDCFAAEVGS